MNFKKETKNLLIKVGLTESLRKSSVTVFNLVKEDFKNELTKSKFSAWDQFEIEDFYIRDGVCYGSEYSLWVKFTGFKYDYKLLCIFGCEKK